MHKIKVMIVDDSTVIRELLGEIIHESIELELISSCSDPIIALEELKNKTPDVIVLDIVMPKMNGLTFLQKIMKDKPIPVLMFSSLTQDGSSHTIDALSFGAIDYIHKPKYSGVNYLAQYEKDVVKKIIEVSQAKLGVNICNENKNNGNTKFNKFKQNSLLAIGASTGGIEALTKIFSALPVQCPPVVVIQHLPANFIPSLVDKISKKIMPKVCIIENNQVLEHGNIYFVPGEKNIKLSLQNKGYIAELTNEDTDSFHKPSIDYLFANLANLNKQEITGIILTGMGKDGANGALKLRNAGSNIIAQDEDSSVVWGMPKEIVKLGAASFVLPLHLIADKALFLSAE